MHPRAAAGRTGRVRISSAFTDHSRNRKRVLRFARHCVAPMSCCSTREQEHTSVDVPHAIELSAPVTPRSQHPKSVAMTTPTMGASSSTADADCEHSSAVEGVGGEISDVVNNCAQPADSKPPPANAAPVPPIRNVNTFSIFVGIVVFICPTVALSLSLAERSPFLNNGDL